jgi:hypothetical protein
MKGWHTAVLCIRSAYRVTDTVVDSPRSAPVNLIIAEAECRTHTTSCIGYSIYNSVSDAGIRCAFHWHSCPSSHAHTRDTNTLEVALLHHIHHPARNRRISRSSRHGLVLPGCGIWPTRWRSSHAPFPRVLTDMRGQPATPSHRTPCSL